MPLPDPVLDPRGYREILNEAIRRIPAHNPEWTNHSDSDPGITLLQLFAFMAESVIYRANRIPERNRLKFLRLLGVTLRPASSARGLVAFSRPAGPLEAATLSGGVALTAARIPFRTEAGLDVLPIEAGVFYKRRLTGDERDAAEETWADLYASFQSPPGDVASLDFYETREMSAPRAGVTLDALDVSGGTVDGLWLALFARRGENPEDARRALAGKTLSLGLLPALDLDARVIEPDRALRDETRQALVFEMPNPDAPAGTGPAYRRIPAAADADPLTHPAVIELTLGDADTLRTWEALEPLEAGSGDYPPPLDDEARAARLITWIRVRLPADASGAGGQPAFRASWLGINAAAVTQRARVTAELLAPGDGEPDQAATLANTPVIPDSLRLTVNGEVWSRIDDLAAAPPEGGGTSAAALVAGPTDPAPYAPPAEAAAKVFTLDPESGEIRFGTGLAGARPPRGAVILAAYDHGGGPEGRVGIGAISRGELPSGVKVSNPAPTWGGAAGETVAQAEARIPGFLAHRDRLVTEPDFRAIAEATPGVDIGRVEILPLLHPDQPTDAAPGVVTVLVIPADDPRNPRAPKPDRLFLDAVVRHLCPRRLVTTELHVLGPDYVDVMVSVAVDVAPGRARAPVREAVKAAIETFLSPLTGGHDGGGWPLGRTVDSAELLVVAARVEGVQRVGGLLLGDAAGPRATPLTLGPLQLPRLAAFSATTEGDPTPLDALTGTAPSGVAGPNATPIPVVPDLC
ncbi:MAG: putative baseplate assembly protein [Rhodobacteraceae bacterium]|nr:putative baseplate assembly protein [Paracoccaceae bacterium]MBR26035.1 putative baseplate assembly protein [Paracoccaceae bacterium]